MAEQKTRYIVEVYSMMRDGQHVMDSCAQVKKFIKDLKTAKPDVQVEVHKVVLTKGTEWKNN